MIRPLRIRARELGYALTVHGSLARDIDLVAVPWTEAAADPFELVAALVTVLNSILDFAGYGTVGDLNTPERKPHGRLAWDIVMWGAYLDLSVMPRRSGEALLT